MTDAAHREPRQGPRWLNVGTALILATVISLVAFMLLSDGEDVAASDDAPVAAAADMVEQDPSSPAVETTVPVTTTIPPPAPASEFRGVSRDLGGGDAATSLPESEGALATATPVVLALNPAGGGTGPTAVSLVTNFPAVDYTWERITLPGAGYLDMSWVGELGGELVVVSTTWDETGEFGGQALVTWSVGAGSEASQLNSVALPENTWINRVVGFADRVYAIGEQVTDEYRSSASYVLMSTTDGSTWVSAELPIASGEAQEHAWVQDAAVGPAGIAIAVQYETYPAEPPQVLEFEEWRVEIDHMTGQYTLTQLSTGEAVLSGPIANLYNWGGVDGQVVADPNTGEVLTVVPWQVWEEAHMFAYEGGYGWSPLPIPIDTGPQEIPLISIEYEGLLITIDEGQGTYTVAMQGEGDEYETVGAGSLDLLYQGPSPQFVDPDSGEVLLSVTWDDWYRAEERSWESFEYSESEFDYSSRTVLFTSPDGGTTWSEETIADGSGGANLFLADTADGFIAVMTAYGERGEQRSVWRMIDDEWDVTPADYSQLWLYNVVHTGDGFVAVGDSAGGQAVWSSPDGVSWATEFATAPQADGSYVWFNAVAADDSSRVGVLATHEEFYEFSPLVIEQARYTATFEESDAAVRITENETGETVLLLTWESLEFEGGTELVTRDGEATVFALDNGDAMLITDVEANAAMESRFVEEAPKVGVSVFLKSGNSWSEVVVDPGGSFSGASQMFMSDGTIMIAGSYWGGHPYDAETPDDAAILLIGAPAGS